MNTPDKTIQEVLDTLSAENLFTPESLPHADALFSAPQEKPNPWYIRMFITLSAWISAILLGSSLAFTILDSDEGVLIIGLLFIIGAIILRSNAKNSDFSKQLALALSISGQFMFIYGYVEVFNLWSSEHYIYLKIGRAHV